MLLTRFPELPKQIVMDNACNLHSYILNREPEYFKDVQFYVDQAHFRGHKNCCPAYNTRAQPSKHAHACDSFGVQNKKYAGMLSHAHDSMPAAGLVSQALRPKSLCMRRALPTHHRLCAC